MKKGILVVLAVIISLCCVEQGMAQLNDVKIGNCPSKHVIDGWIATEEAKGLVMDARPFAINQSRGKLLFTRGAGRVSVIHMNPFVYNYKISVAQQELVTTALTDFLKLILPPSLQGPVPQSGEASKLVDASASTKLSELESRLRTVCPAGTTLATLPACNCPPGTDTLACTATKEMFRVFLTIAPLVAAGSTIVDRLDHSEIRNKTTHIRIDDTNVLYVSFTGDMSDLRNEQLEAYDSCAKAEQINGTLGTYDFKKYFEGLNDAQAKISEVDSLADDLRQLAEDFNKDKDLKDKPLRCNGFNCTNQILKYADAVKAVIGTEGYQKKLEDLRGKGQSMQTMLALTEAMKTKDGLFARTFDVAKKFELSQATITVKREIVEVQPKQTTRSQSGQVKSQVSVGRAVAVEADPVVAGEVVGAVEVKAMWEIHSVQNLFHPRSNRQLRLLAKCQPIQLRWVKREKPLHWPEK